MYALVIDGVIVEVARKPHDLVLLDGSGAPLYWDGITDAELAACGWFAVVNEPPTFDPALEVLERGDVVLVDGVPTVDYTVRAKTAEELAADADAADREAKGINVGQAITVLRAWAVEIEQTSQQMATVTATTNNAVQVLNQLLDALATDFHRTSIFYDRFADLLEYQRLDQLGEA